MVAEGGSDRCVAVFPVRQVSLLRHKDLFARIKAVALAIMIEDQDLRVVRDSHVIMPCQKVVQKVVILHASTERVGKVEIQNRTGGFGGNNHE